MIGELDRKALLDLQKQDKEMDRLRERAMVLPREIDKLDKELAVHLSTLEEQERLLQDLRLDRRGAEREIENAKQHRRDTEAQQFKIRNNQQYQANMREIESMKAKIAQYEEKVLEMLVREDEIQKEIERLQVRVDEERRRHELATRGLKEELEQLTSELQARDAERVGVIDRLSPTLRAKYERIRRSKGDLAIVGVEGGACGGCGYGLPPHRQQEVRRNDQLILCEGCGRILVWIDEDWAR